MQSIVLAEDTTLFFIYFFFLVVRWGESTSERGCTRLIISAGYVAEGTTEERICLFKLVIS